MAVRAEQHALASFGAGRGERAGHTVSREREGLVRAIHVVEVQARERTVVATQRARTARLLDEDALDLAAPAMDGTGAAEAAAEPVTAAAHEGGQSVDRAVGLRRLRTRGASGSRFRQSPGARRFERV